MVYAWPGPAPQQPGLAFLHRVTADLPAPGSLLSQGPESANRVGTEQPGIPLQPCTRCGNFEPKYDPLAELATNL